jgi:hypothetical protein
VSRIDHWSSPQRSTAQRSTAQHGTAQRSTAQRSTAQHSAARHSTARRGTARYERVGVAAQAKRIVVALGTIAALVPLLADQVSVVTRTSHCAPLREVWVVTLDPPVPPLGG